MEYNTQQRRLPLPEYGRSIQNMVDYALTIEDRAERQRCANTIINIMGDMFPLLRDVSDFKHKLWDHLAIMSDFKLDIDYPYEVIKKDSLTQKPETLAYSQGRIRYRHYGKLVEEMVQKAKEIENEEEKKQFISLLANHMKKCFLTWNKDGIDDQKILDDLCEYSGGTIRLTTEDLQLQPQRFMSQQSRKPSANQRKGMQNNVQRKSNNR